jgi:peptidoglycan/xylan/chitin deacetylase (PgdA/CDA1 family)
MNRNVQKILTVLIVLSLSLLIFGAVRVKAQSERGVVTIAFDDGTQSQYDNAYPLMKARGIAGTFYVISNDVGASSYMTVAELQDLQANGNEIGSHSMSHPAFTDLSEQQIRDESSGSKQALQSYGLFVNNFAYPYGIHNDNTDSIVSQYYRSIRSAYAEPYIMSLPTSQSLLQGYPGETGDASSVSQYEALQAAEYEVEQVENNGGWVIIFFHNIIWGDYSGSYEIVAEYFEDFLDYVQASDVSILTVDQALNVAGPSLSASISPTSVIMNPGGSQQFTSTVTGGVSPYTYQWYLNNSAVPGATSPTWTFNPASIGTYKIYLQASDSYTGTAQSNTATVRVTLPLIATISPTSVNMTIGATQQFTSTITGGLAPYTYQWYYANGTTIPATTPTLQYKANHTGTYNIYLNTTDQSAIPVKSNIATAKVETPTAVAITPTQLKMYTGQSQTFNSSITGGTPPYAYQWYLNDTAVPGATGSTWTFTPNGVGHYKVYLNVTDGFGFRVQSNVVSDILVCSVYLHLNEDSVQVSYARGQMVTFTVDVFNQLDPVLGSSLTLTVSGLNSYGYFDVQPIKVPAGTVGEYTFNWVVPNVAGNYIVEVELVPSMLTAYDTAWLKVN